MRMFRLMCGKARKDRLRNNVFVKSKNKHQLKIKLKENKLRQLGYVQQIFLNAMIRNINKITTKENV